MTLPLVLQVFMLLGNTAGIAYGIRIYLRNRRGCPTCAQLAMDAMEDGCVVDGVKLPEPGDRRWRAATIEFDRQGKRLTHPCLVLGSVTVNIDDAVAHVGVGRALASSTHYATRVITAYRQRLVDKDVST